MPAWWFGIPIAIVAAWYTTLLDTPHGYGTAATAAASGALPIIGAFVGATAAWEGSRVRRAGLWGGPWVRADLRLAVTFLWTPVLAGFVAAGAAVVTAHVVSEAPSPAWPIVAVLALDVVAYASVGFALGLLAPTALAVPVAAILPLLWLAFVPAFRPVWLRHLTGMYRDCCGLGEDIAVQPLIASALIDLAMIAVAATMTIATWERAKRWLISGGVLASMTLVGSVLVLGMPFAPVVPRDPSQLACSRSADVELCVWPEHRRQAAVLGSAVADTFGRWRLADIDAPSTFTEALDPPDDAVAVQFTDDESHDRIVLALAAGLAPDIADCPGGSTGGIAVPYLVAWFADAGGVSPEALRELDFPGDDLNPSVLTVVGQLRDAGRSSRQDWMDRAITMAQTCDEIVPDLRVAR